MAAKIWVREAIASCRILRYEGEDLTNDNHIPTFKLPVDSGPRQGFLGVEGFNKLVNAVEKIESEIIQRGSNKDKSIVPTLRFLYIPGSIQKNGKAQTLPLVGPLEPIAIQLRELRKSFPKATEHVFTFQNFRSLWNKACHCPGIGVYDEGKRTYSGLAPHDFRRSAAGNLMQAGVTRQTAMRIMGHETEDIFDCYAIQTGDDIREALIQI